MGPGVSIFGARNVIAKISQSLIDEYADWHWFGVIDGDPRLVALYRRHYSADPAVSSASQREHGVSGVGESKCFMTSACDAGFIWVLNTTERYDGQTGIQCSFFRNEGHTLSSVLILEAEELAWIHWGRRRLWTYVNPTAVRHKRDPGRCFLKAGWRQCGVSKAGLVILEKPPR